MFSKFVFLGQTELLFSITDSIAQQFSRYELVKIEIVYYTLRSEVVCAHQLLGGGARNFHCPTLDFSCSHGISLSHVPNIVDNPASLTPILLSDIAFCYVLASSLHTRAHSIIPVGYTRFLLTS